MTTAEKFSLFIKRLGIKPPELMLSVVERGLIVLDIAPIDIHLENGVWLAPGITDQQVLDLAAYFGVSTLIDPEQTYPYMVTRINIFGQIEYLQVNQTMTESEYQALVAEGLLIP